MNHNGQAVEYGGVKKLSRESPTDAALMLISKFPDWLAEQKPVLCCIAGAGRAGSKKCSGLALWGFYILGFKTGVTAFTRVAAMTALVKRDSGGSVGQAAIN